jgi:hypothetical protein
LHDVQKVHQPSLFRCLPYLARCRYLLHAGAQVAANDVNAAAKSGSVAVLYTFLAAGVDVHAGDELALTTASESTCLRLHEVVAPDLSVPYLNTCLHFNVQVRTVMCPS